MLNVVTRLRVVELHGPNEVEELLDELEPPDELVPLDQLELIDEIELLNVSQSPLVGTLPDD